jgi:hypothetical protein
MSRPTTSDLDRLAHGRAVDKDAFLGLLAEPTAQEDLARLGQAHDVLLAPLRDEPPPMAVGWNELAAHAEGTLIDPRRRQAVEQFLREQAPELLPAQQPDTVNLAGGDTLGPPDS